MLLLQLGTPEAPTPAALRTYLREFLSDRRVIDLPRAQWLPILYGIVLRTRPAKSAALYAKVWTPQGSPLASTTYGQAEALGNWLERTSPGQVNVTFGMRYGKPSISAAVDALLAAGCDRILAFPMYPQYAGATTGSSLERLFQYASGLRVVPSIRVVPPYFDDPAYITALSATVRSSLRAWTPDHIVLSFHGLPKRYAEEGDPYPDQCRETARLLAEREGWGPDRVTVSFQSRFGREEWLRPYTDETLLELARKKVDKLAVLCPGFTADCLETLEEIGITGKESYHAAGGGEYRLLPCLNVHPSWIEALAAITQRELGGWV